MIAASPMPTITPSRRPSSPTWRRGVSLALAHKLLSPETMKAVQKEATSVAQALFGETRGRPPSVGSVPENFDLDPRLLALFNAYKA